MVPPCGTFRLCQCPNNLGNCYYNGTGVTKSVENTFNWAYCAAVAGNVSAMCLVGSCFNDGIGTKKSLEEAGKWYQKGVNKGHAGCMYNLSRLYYGEKRYTEAEDLARQAYRKNHYDAAWIIALCCEYGKADLVEALQWYKKSQEHGIGVNAEKEIARIERLLYPPVPKPAFSGGQNSSYHTYPAGTFSGLDRDSSISFVNRCLKDDLSLCSSEEQRRMVMDRYRSNYPDTPLEDYSSSYSSDSYSSLNDKDYLDLLNDIM